MDKDVPKQLDLLTDHGVDPTHPIFSDIEPHIAQSFFTYHNDNPSIYVLFRQFAYQVMRSGRHHYGAKAIMERLRWHFDIETGGDFKINNNYASCYSRLLMHENPEFEDYFDRRKSPKAVAA